MHIRKLHDTHIVGDETYISVANNWNYTWFNIGSLSRAILSFHISDRRTGINALITILRSLKAVSANKVDFTSDGNPAYDSAVTFINSQHEKPVIRLHKVIGLSNDDDESKQYRPFKQLIERLNRTYKFHTRARCGRKSSEGAVSLTTLFVVYYNWLRPHKALNYKTPVHIDRLDSIPTLQGRWAELLRMAA